MDRGTMFTICMCDVVRDGSLNFLIFFQHQIISFFNSFLFYSISTSIFPVFQYVFQIGGSSRRRCAKSLIEGEKELQRRVKINYQGVVGKDIKSYAFQFEAYILLYYHRTNEEYKIMILDLLKKDTKPYFGFFPFPLFSSFTF